MIPFKDYLYEMAFDRSKAEERVTGLGSPIVLHLIKLLRYSDADNEHKHVADIQNWLIQIAQIKLKRNKQISEADYFKWMIADNLSMRTIKSLHTNYESLTQVRTANDTFSAVNSIGRQLADVLANEHVIDFRAIYAKYKIS